MIHFVFFSDFILFTVFFFSLKSILFSYFLFSKSLNTSINSLTVLSIIGCERSRCYIGLLESHTNPLISIYLDVIPSHIYRGSTISITFRNPNAAFFSLFVRVALMLIMVSLVVIGQFWMTYQSSLYIIFMLSFAYINGSWSLSDICLTAKQKRTP